MKRFWTDSSSVGKLTLLIGLLVLTPLAALIWYPEDSNFAMSFFIPGGGSVLLGLLLCLLGKKDTEAPMDWRSQMGRSGLIVLFAWCWGILIGGLPFVIAGQLRMIPALFESVSGWTTTGLSAMDVSVTPMIFLFHRSFMLYCGGLGFIMMMIIFISNKQSMNLYNAEGHPDRIIPNIKKTAQAIFVIYNLFLVIGTIAYYAAWQAGDLYRRRRVHLRVRSGEKSVQKKAGIVSADRKTCIGLLFPVRRLGQGSSFWELSHNISKKLSKRGMKNGLYCDHVAESNLADRLDRENHRFPKAVGKGRGGTLDLSVDGGG